VERALIADGDGSWDPLVGDRLSVCREGAELAGPLLGTERSALSKRRPSIAAAASLKNSSVPCSPTRKAGVTMLESRLRARINSSGFCALIAPTLMRLRRRIRARKP
jgi:hypothetical protein